MTKKVDDANEEKVATEEEKISTPPAPTPKAVETKVQKLELTPEEFDSAIKAAVAKAQQEQEERIRAEEAKKQGDYKALYEDAQKVAQKANLALWRTNALNKFKLSSKLFDALTGTTEEEIMASAKKLHDTIEAEIEARQTVKDGEVVIPESRGKVKTATQVKVDGEKMTRYQLARSLGLGRVQ